MVDQSSSVVVLLAVLCLLFESTTFGQSVAPLSSLSERLALLGLRSSLGLRSKDWPKKWDPCSNWTGIQCFNGSVVGINISGLRRTRLGRQNPQFSADALADFSLLSYFNASRFLLPGSIPDWFGLKVVSLQVLDLRSCSIVGGIPSTIGNLTRLTGLYLSGNSLTGIVSATLGQLSKLSVLDLSRNSLTGSIPESFASLKSLNLLDMSSNFLSGTVAPALGTLPKLQFLNLSRNSLTSSIPAQLSGLSTLVVLDLSFNSLSGFLPQDFRVLRNLQKLMIGNNFLSGSLPANLFDSLTGLTFISLNNNGFTGELPGVLWSMQQLRFLDLSGNNFTGSMPNLTLHANTTFAVFNLSHNMFYGSLTSIIGRFMFIDLSNNYFKGKVPYYGSANVSLYGNCLQLVSNQRRAAECESFYAEKGLKFDNFGLPNVAQLPRPKSNNKERRTAIILGVVGGIVLITVLTVMLVVVIRCTRKRNSTNQRGTVPGPSPQVASRTPPGVPLNLASLGEAFTYQQILQATGKFSEENLIKHGHSGDLFKAILEGGVQVAIKRVAVGAMTKESIMSELEIFGKLSHPRFVPLLGHCLENENEKFIVFKYMPNGDLSRSLFSKTTMDGDGLQSLDWITRLKIAIGAAEGLSYLHHECNPPLVHRDVQASSILLDDKFEVRLGSLGEVCTQEGEIQQNRLTRLLRLPQTSEQGASGTATATCAYDVYCFGKVLLELVTGKLGISACSDAISRDWFEGTLPYISIYDKELVTNIIDPSLIIDEDLLEEVWAMAIVAKSCLNPKPSRRPLMRYILKALENPLKVVREESTGSSRLRAVSSRGSWNAALFGSWRHSSLDTTAFPVVPANRAERGTILKQSGTSGSQGSVSYEEGGNSSSNIKQSKDIFPELFDVQDAERQNDD